MVTNGNNLPPPAEYPPHLEHVSAVCSQALAAAKLDAIVIETGAPAMHFLDDQPTSWRPNPYFTWWTPLAAAPGSLLSFTPGQPPVLFWVQPEDYWHMPPDPPPASWCSAFEVDIVSSAEQACCRARQRLRNCRAGWVGPAAQYQSDIALPNPAAWLHWVNDHRTRKTPYELNALRGATQRAVRGHLAARDAWAAGASEFAIHLEYLRATDHTDDELPYPSIVATGAHAAVLHYQHRSREATQAQSLLLDAGASSRGYGSDITRTWGAPGVDRFGALIDAMDGLQQRLVAAVRPGPSYVELHQYMHQQLTEVLGAADLVKGSADELLASGITRAFLPHGIGHLLGLQVHDVGGLTSDPQGQPAPPPATDPSLRNTRIIEQGQVFTIEPGLYFIDSLLDEVRTGAHSRLVNWPLVETLKPCGGIRIEDNVAVTANGCENLTRTAFGAVQQ